jgi:hypothetical protein
MNGVALLSVPANVYNIRAEMVGFKMKPVKNVKVPATGSSPPQVQLMLRVAAPVEIID